MSVRIVTDSASDIPPELAKRFAITIVPVIVSVSGHTTKDYKDGELSHNEIYRLQEAGYRLSTSAPAPGDFKQSFEELLSQTNEIVTVVITARESAVYDVALKGKEETLKEHPNCRIAVINSKSVAMGTGLTVMSAAESAAAGKGFEEVVAETNKSISDSKVDAIGILETLRYAIKGGRVVGRVLDKSPIKLRPVLTLKDGKLQSGVTIRAGKADNKLLEFVMSHQGIRDIAVEYAKDSEREGAEILTSEIRKQMRSRLPEESFSNVRFWISQISAVLGVHTGGGARVVAVRTK